MRSRNRLFIAGIAAIALVAAFVSLLLLPRTQKSERDVQQTAVEEAETSFHPLSGCKLSSTESIPGSAETQYSKIFHYTCTARTATEFDKAFQTQLEDAGYAVTASDAPQWGCFETSTGGSKLSCGDEVIASKGSDQASYYLTIDDAAAEKDQTLGTQAYLETKLATQYQLTLSYAPAASSKN